MGSLIQHKVDTANLCNRSVIISFLFWIKPSFLARCVFAIILHSIPSCIAVTIKVLHRCLSFSQLCAKHGKSLTFVFKSSPIFFFLAAREVNFVNHPVLAAIHFFFLWGIQLINIFLQICIFLFYTCCNTRLHSHFTKRLKNTPVKTQN